MAAMAALPTPEYQAPEPSLERPKKRQKIAMACDTCRFRKVKCDGAKPSKLANCAAPVIPAVFSHHCSSARQVSDPHMLNRASWLNKHAVCGICAKRKDKGVGCAYNRDKMKLSGVFDDDHQLSREYESSPLATDLLTEDPGTVSHRTPQERYSLGGKPRAKPLRFSEETVTTQEETGKGIDSMTGVGGDNSNNQQFFGSSSAGSFMKRIKAAIDVKIGMPQASPSEQETSRALYLLSPPTSNGRPQDENIEYVLPSRKTADNLTATYWTLVHPLYPFLDRQVFEDAYNSIWRGSQTGVDERMFMCMVNVIFALGSQLSQSIKAELRGPTAKVYFKRAQELLHLDLWSMGSIELVQTLLLMGQYLQSTTNPHQCWMVIGHAIRIAQGLGLHLAETSAELRSAREREVARRIWHGCIMMDRILSMTLGRPAMISKPLADAVPLPAMVDYEPDSSAMGMLDAHNESRPAMMAFYIKSLHLYGIINDILLALYMGQQRTPQEDNSISLFDRDNSCDITKVFQLDQALMKWGQTMPQHLRVSSYESAQSEIFLRQAVVCRARFLHARILLYRPILSDFCLPQSPPTELGTVIDESLAERMVLQVCCEINGRAHH
jgi:hypothetical protein